MEHAWSTHVEQLPSRLHANLLPDHRAHPLIPTMQPRERTTPGDTNATATSSAIPAPCFQALVAQTRMPAQTPIRHPGPVCALPALPALQHPLQPPTWPPRPLPLVPPNSESDSESLLRPHRIDRTLRSGPRGSRGFHTGSRAAPSGGSGVWVAAPTP